jgi:diguanylate cyclase (GGDEF)-like protein
MAIIPKKSANDSIISYHEKEYIKCRKGGHMISNIIGLFKPIIIINIMLCALWSFFNLRSQKKWKKDKEELQRHCTEMQEHMGSQKTLLQAALQALPGGFYDVRFDPDDSAGFLTGRCKSISWCKAFRFKEQVQPSDWWLERVHPEDRGPLLEAWQSFLTRNGGVNTLCYRLLDGRGVYREILTCQNYPVLDDTGMMHLSGMDMDISSVYRHQDTEGFDHVLAGALVNSQDVLATVTDSRGKVFYANDLVQQHLGREEAELVGKSWDKIILEVKEQTNSGDTHLDYFPSVFGGPRSVRWFNNEILNQKGERASLSLGIDSTEIEEAKKEINRLAYYDALTGLPNRVKMFSDLEGVLQKYPRNVAMLFLDLDEFKDINDVFGHDMGDEVLRNFAQLLSIALGEYPVYRLGGDEFVCLLQSLNVESEVKRMAKRLFKLLQSPVSVHNKNYYLSCSIGAALYPEHGINEKELYKAADIAMYYAKEKGKNRLCFYNPELTNQALYRIAISSDIHKGLLKKEFHMVYQPICTKDQIYGFEALIRWKHPVFGSIAPLDFIPLAEKNGTIGELGYWILDQVFSDIKRFHDQVGEQQTFFINVSAKQLRDKKFVTKVQRKLFEMDIDARYVIFEITESAVIEDFDAFRDILMQIRELGIRIALDDFGTGYSSLSYLTKLPVDIVKLDKSFIDNVSLRSDKNLIHNLIQLIQDYGMQTVGEGIETQNQFEELKKLHCSYFQGYYMSKPKLPKELWIDMGLVN